MAEGGLGIKWIILCAGPSERGHGETKSLESKKVLLLNKLCFSTGVSAAFAVKLFKSWINEKDINAVAASLRKVSMDNRLMVCDFSFFTFLTTLKENMTGSFPIFNLWEEGKCVFWMIWRPFNQIKFSFQELFPANKQSVEHFTKYFTEAGLKELSEYVRNQQTIGARKELQKELQEQMSRGDPFKDVSISPEWVLIIAIECYAGALPQSFSYLVPNMCPQIQIVGDFVGCRPIDRPFCFHHGLFLGNLLMCNIRFRSRSLYLLVLKVMWLVVCGLLIFASCMERSLCFL